MRVGPKLLIVFAATFAIAAYVRYYNFGITTAPSTAMVDDAQQQHLQLQPSVASANHVPAAAIVKTPHPKAKNSHHRRREAMQEEELLLNASAIWRCPRFALLEALFTTTTTSAAVTAETAISSSRARVAVERRKRRIPGQPDAERAAVVLLEDVCIALFISRGSGNSSSSSSVPQNDDESASRRFFAGLRTVGDHHGGSSSGFKNALVSAFEKAVAMGEGGTFGDRLAALREQLRSFGGGNIEKQGAGEQEGKATKEKKEKRSKRTRKEMQEDEVLLQETTTSQKREGEEGKQHTVPAAAATGTATHHDLPIANGHGSKGWASFVSWLTSDIRALPPSAKGSANGEVAIDGHEHFRFFEDGSAFPIFNNAGGGSSIETLHEAVDFFTSTNSLKEEGTKNDEHQQRRRKQHPIFFDFSSSSQTSKSQQEDVPLHTTVASSDSHENSAVFQSLLAALVPSGISYTHLYVPSTTGDANSEEMKTKKRRRKSYVCFKRLRIYVPQLLVGVGHTAEEGKDKEDEKGRNVGKAVVSEDEKSGAKKEEAAAVTTTRKQHHQNSFIFADAVAHCISNAQHSSWTSLISSLSPPSASSSASLQRHDVVYIAPQRHRQIQKQFVATTESQLKSLFELVQKNHHGSSSASPPLPTVTVFPPSSTSSSSSIHEELLFLVRHAIAPKKEGVVVFGVQSFWTDVVRLFCGFSVMPAASAAAAAKTTTLITVPLPSALCRWGFQVVTTTNRRNSNKNAKKSSSSSSVGAANITLLPEIITQLPITLQRARTFHCPRVRLSDRDSSAVTVVPLACGDFKAVAVAATTTTSQPKLKHLVVESSEDDISTLSAGGGGSISSSASSSPLCTVLPATPSCSTRERGASLVTHSRLWYSVAELVLLQSAAGTKNTAAEHYKPSSSCPIDVPTNQGREGGGSSFFSLSSSLSFFLAHLRHTLSSLHDTARFLDGPERLQKQFGWAPTHATFLVDPRREEEGRGIGGGGAHTSVSKVVCEHLLPAAVTNLDGCSFIGIPSSSAKEQQLSRKLSGLFSGEGDENPQQPNLRFAVKQGAKRLDALGNMRTAGHRVGQHEARQTRSHVLVVPNVQDLFERAEDGVTAALFSAPGEYKQRRRRLETSSGSNGSSVIVSVRDGSSLFGVRTLPLFLHPDVTIVLMLQAQQSERRRSEFQGKLRNFGLDCHDHTTTVATTAQNDQENDHVPPSVVCVYTQCESFKSRQQCEQHSDRCSYVQGECFRRCELYDSYTDCVTSHWRCRLTARAQAGSSATSYVNAPTSVVHPQSKEGFGICEPLKEFEVPHSDGPPERESSCLGVDNATDTVPSFSSSPAVVVGKQKQQEQEQEQNQDQEGGKETPTAQGSLAKFQSLSSWMFKRWSKWSGQCAKDVEREGRGFAAHVTPASSSSSSSQQQSPKLNQYVVKNFCINPLGKGLRFYKGDIAPYKGKDETSNLYHRTTSFKHFLEQGEPLAERPSCFLDTKVLLFPVSQNGMFNHAHTYLRAVSAQNMLVKLFGKNKSDNNNNDKNKSSAAEEVGKHPDDWEMASNDKKELHHRPHYWKDVLVIYILYKESEPNLHDNAAAHFYLPLAQHWASVFGYDTRAGNNPTLATVKSYVAASWNRRFQQRGSNNNTTSSSMTMMKEGEKMVAIDQRQYAAILKTMQRTQLCFKEAFAWYDCVDCGKPETEHFTFPLLGRRVRSHTYPSYMRFKRAQASCYGAQVRSAANTESPVVLYSYRSYKRRFLNETQIIGHLAHWYTHEKGAKSFRVFELSKFSPAAYTKLVMDADIVLGMHGSMLHNALLLLPPGGVAQIINFPGFRCEFFTSIDQYPNCDFGGHAYTGGVHISVYGTEPHNLNFHSKTTHMLHLPLSAFLKIAQNSICALRTADPGKNCDLQHQSTQEELRRYRADDDGMVMRSVLQLYDFPANYLRASKGISGALRRHRLVPKKTEAPMLVEFLWSGSENSSTVTASWGKAPSLRTILSNSISRVGRYHAISGRPSQIANFGTYKQRHVILVIHDGSAASELTSNQLGAFARKNPHVSLLVLKPSQHHVLRGLLQQQQQGTKNSGSSTSKESKWDCNVEGEYCLFTQG